MRGLSYKKQAAARFQHHQQLLITSKSSAALITRSILTNYNIYTIILYHSSIIPNLNSKASIPFSLDPLIPCFYADRLLQSIIINNRYVGLAVVHSLVPLILRKAQKELPQNLQPLTGCSQYLRLPGLSQSRLLRARACRSDRKHPFRAQIRKSSGRHHPVE